VASVVPECAWSARRRFWIMPHQSQLHLTAPLPSRARPGTPLSRQPAAAGVRTPPAGQDTCWIPPTLEVRSVRASCPPPPKIPGQARRPAGTTNLRGPATIPPLSAGRPDPREEGRGAWTPWAPGPPHYIPGHPGSDLPARLMTAINLRGTPGLPVIDLPGTRAAIRRRPATTTRPTHPILRKVVRCWSRMWLLQGVRWA
jgi:hypothetical protein